MSITSVVIGQDKDHTLQVMHLNEFEGLVSKALEDLPAPVLEMLENVAVTVADFPTHEQMQQNRIHDRYDLLGLYEGIPLTDRPSGYSMVLPDKITIFKGPLEAISESSEMLAQEVRNTIVHELAHHFGFDDSDLESLGR